MLRSIKSKLRRTRINPVSVTSAGASSTPSNVSVTTSRASTGKFDITANVGGYINPIVLAFPHKGTGNHICQLDESECSNKKVRIETRLGADGTVSNAAFDAFVFNSDAWSNRFTTIVHPVKTHGRGRYLVFKINGTAGTLALGTKYDGRLVKNGTGDYSIHVRYPSRQTLHVFAAPTSSANFCQLISKTKETARIGVYASNGSSADDDVIVLICCVDSPTLGWGNSITSAKTTRGGMLMLPFRVGNAYVAETKSSKTHGTGNSQIVWTSKLTGPAGDDTSVAIVDPGEDGTLSVAVVGQAITVTSAYATGAMTSTVAQIKTAIEGTPAAHALVGVGYGAGNGTGVSTALTATNLSGGVDEDLPRLSMGNEFLAITRNDAGDWTLTTRRKYRLACIGLATAAADSNTVPRVATYSGSTTTARFKCSQDVPIQGVVICFDQEN